MSYTSSTALNNDNPLKTPIHLTFTGNGFEYFKIWIVNIALTVLTCGIYSAWAKVRRLQYFNRHTHLDGSSFDYHGEPLKILKGRIISVGLFSAISISSNINPILYFICLALFFIAMPWMIWAGLRFMTANTSYRGVRFGFNGDLKQAYITYGLWGFLTVCTVYILLPWSLQRNCHYVFGNLTFGNAKFQFNAKVKPFIGFVLRYIGMMIGIIIVIGGGIAYLFQDFKNSLNYNSLIISSVVGFPFMILLFAVVKTWFTVYLNNLIWNNISIHTEYSNDSTMSQLQVKEQFWIVLTNILGILLTFGLFKPFADVRIARYRVEHSGLASQYVLSAAIQNQLLNESALGQESADLFDIDVGL